MPQKGAYKMVAWILPAIFGAIFIFISFSNTIFIIRGRSIVPFLGAGFGVLGVLTLPIEGAWKYFWIPIVFDPGTLMMIIGLLVQLKGSSRDDNGQ